MKVVGTHVYPNIPDGAITALEEAYRAQTHLTIDYGGWSHHGVLTEHGSRSRLKYLTFYPRKGIWRCAGWPSISQITSGEEVLWTRTEPAPQVHLVKTELTQLELQLNLSAKHQSSPAG